MRWRLPNTPKPQTAEDGPAPEKPVSVQVQAAWELEKKNDIAATIEAYGRLVSAEIPKVSPEAAYFLGMGYIDHEDEDQALDAFGEARRFEHPVYSPVAGIMICLIYYAREDHVRAED